MRTSVQSRSLFKLANCKLEQGLDPAKCEGCGMHSMLMEVEEDGTFRLGCTGCNYARGGMGGSLYSLHKAIVPIYGGWNVAVCWERLLVFHCPLGAFFGPLECRTIFQLWWMVQGDLTPLKNAQNERANSEMHPKPESPPPPHPCHRVQN